MNINLDKIKNIISKNYFGEIYNYIMSGKTDIRAIVIVQEGFSIEDVGFSFVNAEVPFDLRQLHDDNAVCWCLLGATSKCYAKSGKFKTMFDVLSASLIDSIADFNDHSIYEEVLNFVKRFDI